MADLEVKGQAFSTDAVTDDVYFRTDTDMRQWYTYDGTQWISTQVYESSVKQTHSTDGVLAFDGRIDDGSAIYIEGIDVTSFVAGTNNGANYWTFEIRSYGGAYTADSNTTISASVTTDSDTADVFTNHDADATVASATPPDYGMFATYAEATSTPGNLTLLTNVRYRKIQT